MGHGKLRKFQENLTFKCLVQPSAEEVMDKSSGVLRLLDNPLKGKWGEKFFGNSNPIVLELGCGGGEYTIALARRNPSVNYIGVDIKGARLWKGAKVATLENLPNVGFLRTRIEFIEAFFGPGEVAEIWLTFSDPQLHGSENSRLTSPMFLRRYSHFLTPGGKIHLKTDSRFLHEYTLSVVEANNLEILFRNTDIYSGKGNLQEPSLRDPSHLRWAPPSYKAEGGHGFGEVTLPGIVTEVQTFYEKMFLQRGIPITYLEFTLGEKTEFVYPVDFDSAYWLEREFVL